MDAPVVHDMQASLSVGAWGEEVVKAWLQSRGLDVADVRDVRFFQGMDIDFLAVREGRPVFTVEVKADQNLYNLYLEEWSTLYPDGTGLPGWTQITQADLITYYFVRRGLIYVLPVPALREWMKRRLNDFEAKHPQNWHGYGAHRHVASSQGRAIPREVIEQEIPGVRVFSGFPKMGRNG